MVELRRPADVPDELTGAGLLEARSVACGFDTDADGRPDTVVSDDGVDLVVRTDLDGDSIADQVLRIGSDGIVREVLFAPETGDGAFDSGLDGLDPG